MALRIYLLHTDELNKLLTDEERVSKFEGLTEPGRQMRLSKIRAKEKKAECLGAGLLLRYAFECEYGEKASDLIRRVQYEENGKPFISRDTNIKCIFNISHSGDWMAVCLYVGDYEVEAGRRGEINAVGMDLQQVRGLRESVLRKCFSEEEIAYATDDRKACELWSRKESILKYTGQGISVDLKKVEAFSQNRWVHSFLIDNNRYAISLCTDSEQDYELVQVHADEMKQCFCKNT